MDLDSVLDDLKNKRIRSTVSQLEDFKKSIIWQDIRDELNAWQIQTWELLDITRDVALAGELRGRSRCLSDTAKVLDTLIETADQKAEDKNDS